MEALYRQLKKEAERLRADLPEPSFYRIYREQIRRSSQVLSTGDILRRCINHLNITQEGLGHGFEHSKAVAIEAGALVLIEAENYGLHDSNRQRLLLLAHIAGLLHDIKRGHPDHAILASQEVPQHLQCLDLSPEEIEYIKVAIRNHEAFQDTVEPPDTKGRLLSDCLYDADKFRWGPDNFTTTIWQMLEFGKVSPEEFLRNYHKGIEYIERIKNTFRTSTGKRFGPEIIETGLKIGSFIYKKLKESLPELPSQEK